MILAVGIKAAKNEVAPGWWSSYEDPGMILIVREKIASEIVRLKQEKK
jgi:hypothetical protein